jgi:tetratricopeptide (TPR) repeat protein
MGDAISYLGGNGAEERALNEYLAAEKVARRLVEMAPAEGRYQRHLMFALQKVGDARKELGALDAAISEYKAALELIQKLVREAPDSRNWRRDAANAQRRVGQALSYKSDFNGALEQLRGALEILKDLTQAHPNDDGVVSNLASNHRDIADVHARSGELGLALEEYTNAINIQQGLTTKDPSNTTWKSSLASFSTATGEVLKRQEKLEGAFAHYETAYHIREELAHKDPSNPNAQRRLATAAISVADLLSAQKRDLDEAETMYRQAIDILDEARPRFDRDVFNCYIKVGDILLLRQDRAGASTDYKRAQAIARERVGSGTSSEWQRNLMVSRVKELLTFDERAHWTPEKYQQILVALGELVSIEPQNLEWSTLMGKLKLEIQELERKP